MYNVQRAYGMVEGFIRAQPNVPTEMIMALKTLEGCIDAMTPDGGTGNKTVARSKDYSTGAVDALKVCHPNAPEHIWNTEKSDEAKITAHIEENGVTKVEKKPRKPHNMTPENKERAAQRMRDYQARKRAEKEAASSGAVGEGEEIHGDTETLENGVTINPDGSYSL